MEHITTAQVHHDERGAPPTNRTIAGGMLCALAAGLFIDAAALTVAGSPAGNYAPGVMTGILGLLLAVVGTGAIIDERRARRR